MYYPNGGTFESKQEGSMVNYWARTTGISQNVLNSLGHVGPLKQDQTAKMA